MSLADWTKPATCLLLTPWSTVQLGPIKASVTSQQKITGSSEVLRNGKLDTEWHTNELQNMSHYSTDVCERTACTPWRQSGCFKAQSLSSND